MSKGRTKAGALSLTHQIKSLGIFLQYPLGYSTRPKSSNLFTCSYTFARSMDVLNLASMAGGMKEDGLVE